MLLSNLFSSKASLLISKLKDFLVGAEGYRNKAYQDIYGNWTIGFGHLIKGSEPDLKTKTITLAEATELFLSDMADAMNPVNSNFPYLTVNQAVAVISLVYNEGWGNFQKTRLYAYLKSDRIYDKGLILSYFKSATGANPELDSRRVKEANLFNS